MITTAELLAAAKARQGIPSNYRLARVLDVPESTVQRWNTGRGRPDDRYSAKLAELAGLDACEVVASINAERAEDGPMKEMWALMAKRLHGHAHAAALAFMALVLSLFVGGGPDAGAWAKAPALGSQPQQSLTAAARLYIMSTTKSTSFLG